MMMKAKLIAPGAACAMLAACTPQNTPGQASSHRLDADFPVAALKAKNLKEVRLELAFIPSQFREETLDFTVSIGGQ